MSRLFKSIKKQYVVWIGVLFLVLVTVFSVYAIKPTISLNSPTSFPVDI